MRLLVLSLFLSATVIGCADYGGPGDGGDADSINGGDPGDYKAEDGDGGEIHDRGGDRGGDQGGDRGGDRGGDDGRCRTNQDCATPDNPPLPEDACCGCGAWCDQYSGTCTTMCVDAMCCFYGTGCGEYCEVLCDQHEQCWEEDRCLDGECLNQPPTCGVEPPPGCHSGLEAAECQALGGSYVCSPAGMCWCICPTGDAGCPCWKPEHCDSLCTAELTGTNCADVVIGACNGLIQMPPGCYCVAEENGSFSGLCID